MIRKISLENFATACMLVVSTIGFAQVNTASLELFPIIRILTLFGFGIAMALLIIRKGGGVILFIMIPIFSFLYPLTALRSPQFIYNELGVENIIISFCVIIAGTITLTIASEEKRNIFIPKFLIVYPLLVLLFLMVTGGVDVLPVPRFNFDITLVSGTTVLYNQGASKFFGLAAIAAFWTTLQTRSYVWKFFSIVLIFIFILLSFIGGGRGDFLSVIIVIALIAMKRDVKYFVAAAFVFGILYSSFGLIIYNSLADTTAALRFEKIVQDQSFGERDLLFLQGLWLLSNEATCLVFGCGFGYFQEYYNYPYGLYPHNIVLESVITWGLIIFLPLIALIITGLFNLRGELGILFWIGTFFLLVGFKSGDLLNSWFAMSFVIFLAAKGAERLRKPKLYHGPSDAVRIMRRG